MYIKVSSRPVLGSNGVSLLADTTDTSLRDVFVTISLSDEDVSTLTPAGAPRVTHDPVGSGSGGVVSFKRDSVIEEGTTSSGEDTAGVGLEGHLVGLDGDGHRGSLQSVHHVSIDLARSLSRVVVNSSIADNLSNTLRGVVRASSILSGVGVVSVALLSGLLEVFPSIVVPATTAASVVPGSVTGSTIDELLGREDGESISSHALSTLDGLSGGESPAGSALALILNRGDAATRSVVAAV